jgi:hypothetical protein
MQAAARLAELNAHPTLMARPGLGATARSTFAPRCPPEVGNHSPARKRISVHSHDPKYQTNNKKISNKEQTKKTTIEIASLSN